MNGIDFVIACLMAVGVVQQWEIATLQRRQRAMHKRLGEVALEVFRRDKK